MLLLLLLLPLMSMSCSGAAAVIVTTAVAPRLPDRCWWRASFGWPLLLLLLLHRHGLLPRPQQMTIFQQISEIRTAHLAAAAAGAAAVLVALVRLIAGWCQGSSSGTTSSNCSTSVASCAGLMCTRSCCCWYWHNTLHSRAIEIGQLLLLILSLTLLPVVLLLLLLLTATSLQMLLAVTCWVLLLLLLMDMGVFLTWCFCGSSAAPFNMNELQRCVSPITAATAAATCDSHCNLWHRQQHQVHRQERPPLSELLSAEWPSKVAVGIMVPKLLCTSGVALDCC